VRSVTSLGSSTKDHFAAYKRARSTTWGSAGERTTVREPWRNRVLNHAIHMAAVTQLRNPGPGRDYYQRKIDSGKKPKAALRCPQAPGQRRDLPAPRPRRGEGVGGPGGHMGATRNTSATGSTPTAGSSVKPQPRTRKNVTPPWRARLDNRGVPLSLACWKSRRDGDELHMRASATTHVWLSGDRVIVCGYSQGPVTWTLDGDVTAVAASASTAELGAAVHGMLERPARTVEVAEQKPLLSAARVRSYRQLEREYALVSVDLDGGTLSIRRLEARRWRPGAHRRVSPTTGRLGCRSR